VNQLGVYEVTSRRGYRGHLPGQVFEAVLDPNAEARAINRGSIRLLERVEANLPAGKYRLPTGWPITAERNGDG
jgi:hypothetical protein